MQTLIRPQYLLRVRLIPSILTGSSLIPLRKLHSESRLQEEFREHTGPPQHKHSKDEVFSRWKEFYTRARAIRNKGSRGGDLKKHAKGEPADIFNASHTTLNAIGETFEKIEKEEPYSFPKDGDPTLHAACEALSHALQKASIDKAKRDTPEVKQALNNLRKTYDKAAESNTISMRYIDAEPPYAPFSPLMPSVSLKRILLARSWVKELITEVHNQSLGPRVLVVGNPGSGKSVTLVGYLLFYLIAMGARVILQTQSLPGIMGFAFDADGVHEIQAVDAWRYADGKPCYLLVSADDSLTYPLPVFGSCTATIVVTSSNLKSKSHLNTWRKQDNAYQFVAPPPSCAEVVYLFSKVWQYDSYFVYWMYREWARDFRCCKRDCESAIRHLKNGTLIKWYRKKTQNIMFHARSMLAGVIYPVGEHQVFDDETNMAIPNDLVTMERRKEPNNNGYEDYEDYNDYNVMLMTPRIADIVADVQQERTWRFDWEVLNLHLRNPETRAAARNQFKKMFLETFRKDLSKMPPCFEMGNTSGMHPQSPRKENAKAAMPWEGLSAPPTVEYVSIGKDADGSYSEKELRAVIDAAMHKDSPPIRLLIPCAKNWPSWDATVVLCAEEEEKRVVHIIFLQMTVREDHEIHAKGLNLVRDAIPAKGKLGDGLEIHYHYVLVLLVDDGSPLQIPRKDSSWSRDDLRQYVMFVHKKELYKTFSQD